MNWHENFDETFDKQRKAIQRTITVAWIVSVPIIFCIIASVIFVVYKILAHFGIL